MKKPASTNVAIVPTKANIQKPPQPNSMKFLGALQEKPEFTADNMADPDTKARDLNFKVSPEFHTKFKMTAAAAGLSMKELLEDSFKAWVVMRGSHE
jgi:predicted HicB family RNase H-like nuclease